MEWGTLETTNNILFVIAFIQIIKFLRSLDN